jgi:hypothetical protein
VEREMSNEPNQGGLNINFVFTVSMAICAGIGLWGIIDPDSMTGSMLGFVNYMRTGVSWAWLAI